MNYDENFWNALKRIYNIESNPESISELIESIQNGGEKYIMENSNSSPYYKNWQYGTTKEVLAVHERIDPFDIELDTDANPDFALWEKEMGWDKK